MIIHSTKIYTGAGPISGFMEVEKGKIAGLYTEEQGREKGIAADMDAGDRRIIPGILDTHNHGGFGVRINDGCTKEDVKRYLKGLASKGVTGVFPTTFDRKAMRLVHDMAGVFQDGAQILGIHSEGPWGARVGEKGVNTGYPKVDMEVARQMVEAGGGLLKLVAIAPEVEGAGEAIDYFLSQGVAMAIYHTNADYDQANAAIDRGITVATHLGNVMTGIHHRDIGTLGACLLRDEVDCELICDGLHVSLPMIRLVLKVKDHNKIIMVSDNVEYAGVPAGEYERPMQAQDSDRRRIRVTEEGLVVSKSGRLTGSSKPVLYGMKNLVEKLGLPLEEVIRFSSLNPCRKYGLDQDKGSIEVGKDGDFVILTDEFEAAWTYCRGELVYDRDRDRELFDPAFLKKYKVG